MKFRVEGIYDAKKLGIPQMLILGLQHMFAMFGATILVPILVNNYFHGEGLSIQVTLFCAGFGTLLFHVLTKLKVPAFLGSSFAFLGGFATVAELDTGIFANMSYGEKLPYACGGVFVAGLLYLVLALIALGTVIFFNIWGTGMFRIIPILMGIVVSYAAALIMNALGMTNADGSAILNFAGVASAPIVGVPKFFLCKFNITAILAMAPIAIASMMEHIGDISAISATVDRNFIEDPGLHRTLLGDGLATSLSALIGGPANTTYGENTSVLALSRVYDPKVIRLAAIYAVILSFIPKMAEVISSLPSAIIGGISFILYGMISAVGVRNVVENKVDLTRSRNLVITAVILVCGLGVSDGLTFTIAGAHITLTGLALAAIVGIVLNAVLPGNDYVFESGKKKEEYEDD